MYYTVFLPFFHSRFERANPDLGCANIGTFIYFENCIKLIVL